MPGAAPPTAAEPLPDPGGRLALHGDAGAHALEDEPNYKIVLARNVVYGVGQVMAPEPYYKDLVLDVYRPAARIKDKIGVVMAHGGGFRALSKNQGGHRRMAKFLAARGVAAFVIDYRQVQDDPVAPEPHNETRLDRARFAAITDTKAAVRWVRANADYYGVDPNKIVVLGSSAGATCAYNVALSNDTDYTGLDEIEAASNHPEQPAHVAAAVALWGDPRMALDEVDPADPPMMIVHSTLDGKASAQFAPVEQLAGALQNAGVSVTLYAEDVPRHTFWGQEIQGKSVGQLVLEFLQLTF